MMRAAHVSLVARLAIPLLGLPGLAQAKPSPAPASPPETAAQQDDQGAAQFTEGRQLYKEGSFAAALPLFERALAASGSPNARLYVARTLRELGRLPEAHQQMSEALDGARAQVSSEPRYAATRDAAAAELAALESKIGRLVVAVSPGIEGVQVSVDGKPVTEDQIGRVIVVEPGSRSITASAPGQTELRREVTVQPGATETVLLAFEPQGRASKTAAPAADTSEGSAFGPVRVAGLIVAVVGVAGLVVYAVSASGAKSSYDTLNEQCGGQRCTDPSYADEVDYGETMETLSHVSLAVGLAAVVTGGIMLVVGDSDDESSSQTATIGVRGAGPWMSYTVPF